MSRTDNPGARREARRLARAARQERRRQSRTVCIVMTRAQAQLLAYAAGNTCEHPDAARAVFPVGTQRAAALRGLSILRRAAWGD